jgi:hypothetical protein
MLFKWELIEKIVRGEKIQTRRPEKDNEELRGWYELGTERKRIVSYHGDKYRTKIECGKDYAVQYGRGKPTAYYQKYRGESRMVREALPYEKYKKAFDKHGVTASWYLQQQGYHPLRILITDIRREDVRDISWADTEAEGFTNRSDFWKTWCAFYDKPGLAVIEAHCPYDVIIQAGLKERPDELYQAWAYTFEVV